MRFISNKLFLVGLLGLFVAVATFPLKAQSAAPEYSQGGGVGLDEDEATADLPGVDEPVVILKEAQGSLGRKVVRSLPWISLAASIILGVALIVAKVKGKLGKRKSWLDELDRINEEEKRLSDQGSRDSGSGGASGGGGAGGSGGSGGDGGGGGDGRGGRGGGNDGVRRDDEDREEDGEDEIRSYFERDEGSQVGLEPVNPENGEGMLP